MSRSTAATNTAFIDCLRNLREPFTMHHVCAAFPKLSRPTVSNRMTAAIRSGLLIEGATVGPRRERLLLRSVRFESIAAAQDRGPRVDWADGARTVACLVPWLRA